MREFIKLEIYEKAYIIICVNKRDYVCLDDIHFCTIDKDKDIIKLGYSDAFDGCISEIKEKK